MSRGLRQGCPLSPFLFNIVAEVLSIFLKKAASRGLFEELKIGNVHLSHLQYADDTIIFCKAGEDHLLNVKSVLRCFQLVSGLKINFSKSSVLGVKVDQREIQSWADRINCKVGMLHCTYLGLPLGAKLKSISVWENVADKFRLKLAAWKAGHLSFGGRVALIKSVLASLPVYYMSIFLIPFTIKDESKKIMRRFLWAGASSGKKMHLVDWDAICNLKELEGLGIFKLTFRNRALLNKWLWRFGNERDSLWINVIVKKNGLRSNEIISARGNSVMCSSWWKAITLLLFQEDKFAKFTRDGQFISIGNGRDVDFSNDKWAENFCFREAFPRVFALGINEDGKANEFGHLIGYKWE